MQRILSKNIKILLIIFIPIFLSGCIGYQLDQLSGGYRHCGKHQVTWHTYYGETHNCKEGAIVKNSKGEIIKSRGTE